MPGYCTIEATFTGSKTEMFKGKFGEFEYVKQARQIPRTKRCGIPIPPGQTRHDGGHCHYFPDEAHEIHFCTANCPTCENICVKEFGHAGLHNTNHSNMVNKVIVCESAEGADLGDRRYARGESARAEMCDHFCKRLGRGPHIHIMRCPGNHENVNDPRLKHDITHVDIDPSLVLDEVTHEYYWEQCKFEDNCTDAERGLYQKCCFICETVERTPDFGADHDAFCQLDLWHAPLSSKHPVAEGHVSSGGHHFRCHHEKNIGHHVVLVIDKSSSMSENDQRPGESSPLRGGELDNRFGAVLETCDAFCRKRSSASRNDALTVIFFSTKATSHWVGEPMSPCLSAVFSQRVVIEGGTCYAPALPEARDAIASFAQKDVANREMLPVVIMLSDNECHDPKNAVAEAASLKKSSDDLTRASPIVFCIRFGSNASGKDVLRKISSDDEVSQSETTIELDKVFHTYHEKMVRGTIGVLDKDLF